jgi:hypothetical protein
MFSNRCPARVGVALIVSVLASGTLAQGRSAPPVLGPDQAKDHIGEVASVQGLVFGVHTSRGGATYINFGAPYPRNTFTAVIFASDAGTVTPLAALQGARVQVTGRIALYQGKPEIVLKNPAQLKVITPAPRAQPRASAPPDH